MNKLKTFLLLILICGSLLGINNRTPKSNDREGIFENRRWLEVVV